MDSTTEPTIRATYEELEIEGKTFGAVADPKNDEAWVQSDQVVQVRS